MSVVIDNDGYKEVRFDKYCKTCKHGLTPMVSENNVYNARCCDCLDNPTNQYSEKPVNWEEKDD